MTPYMIYLVVRLTVAGYRLTEVFMVKSDLDNCAHVAWLVDQC